MPERRKEIIGFPQPIRNVDPSVLDALEEIRRHLGFLTSLVVIPLMLSETGLGLTASGGAGTAIAQANTTLDLEDARISSVRLVGYGDSSGTGDVVNVLVGGSTVVCSASVPSTLGAIIGDWTRYAPAGGDLAYSVAIVGNGVRTQTLHRLELHARTVVL